MKIFKAHETPRMPADGPLFTGTVHRQDVVPSDELTDFSCGLVSFSPGSRNKFHTHTSDQILVVTEGTGTVATENDEVTVTSGDVVVIPAGEKHWHGAPGSTAMAHLTILAKHSRTTQLED